MDTQAENAPEAKIRIWREHIYILKCSMFNMGAIGAREMAK